jgi:hypothetical protein
MGPRSFTPFSRAALALAPAVSIPDAALTALRQSDEAIRHRSSALLLLWHHVVWRWERPLIAVLGSWLELLPEHAWRMIRREERTGAGVEVLGGWRDNPFELDWLGDLHYVVKGEHVDLGRFDPHPHRLTRRFVPGRLEIRATGVDRARRPGEDAALVPRRAAAPITGR